MAKCVITIVDVGTKIDISCNSDIDMIQGVDEENTMAQNFAAVAMLAMKNFGEGKSKEEVEYPVHSSTPRMH